MDVLRGHNLLTPWAQLT